MDQDEVEFLAAYDSSRYPRPSVTVDVVLLTVAGNALHALLAHRAEPPARGSWSLPGGFVRLDESLDAAATRVLRDKAGLDDIFVEQLFTFGGLGRDPRTRVISVAYYALVEPERLRRAVASFDGDLLCIARVEVPDGGGQARAQSEDGSVLPLAFDHDEIVATAVRRVRGKLDYASIGFEFLPPSFSLRDLRLVHEAILGRALNKDSFRRRIVDRGLVVPTGRRAAGVGHRPPELYAFSGAGR